MSCKPFKYAFVPEGYECTKCGLTNCKLWREYQVFANKTKLFCAYCGVENQKLSKVFISEDGFLIRDEDVNFKTDQIGWLVPAIPCEEGNSYWGYTSVPIEGVIWWRNLPN